jgi:hypothetical protein
MIKKAGLVSGVATGNLKGEQNTGLRAGLVEEAPYDLAGSPPGGLVHPRSG